MSERVIQLVPIASEESAPDGSSRSVVVVRGRALRGNQLEWATVQSLPMAVSRFRPFPDGRDRLISGKLVIGVLRHLTTSLCLTNFAKSAIRTWDGGRWLSAIHTCQSRSEPLDSRGRQRHPCPNAPTVDPLDILELSHVCLKLYPDVIDIIFTRT